MELSEARGQLVVIGGTSAGAAMMSNSMFIRGKSDETPRFGVMEVGPGMDFLVGVVIDTHFSQHGRIGRLLTAVARIGYEFVQKSYRALAIFCSFTDTGIFNSPEKVLAQESVSERLLIEFVFMRIS